jgi:hypothetical protein
MAIYSASQATSAVETYSQQQADARAQAQLQTYQWLFDRIQAVAELGDTTLTAILTRYDYSQVSTLLSNAGYTVIFDATQTSSFPLDGILSTDQVRKYGLSIHWPSISEFNQTYPELTGLSPLQFTATRGQTVSARFVPQGGVSPFTFAINGVTPAGLTWSTLTNVTYITLSGTPTEGADEYNMLTITVTDSQGQTLTELINWNVQNATANLDVITTAQGTNQLTYANGILTFTPYAYTLPIATHTTLGGVKVDGTTIVSDNGMLSATYTLPTASTTVKGGAYIDGTTITISPVGVISANTSYTLPTASTSILGGVKIDGTSIQINGSGTISLVTTVLDQRIRNISTAMAIGLH